MRLGRGRPPRPRLRLRLHRGRSLRHVCDESDGGTPAELEDDSGAPGEAEGATTIIIAAFDELPEKAAFQGYEPSKIVSTNELNPPDTFIGAIVSDPDASAIFAPATAVPYTPSTTLLKGYALVEGVNLPDITVAIRWNAVALGISSVDISETMTFPIYKLQSKLSFMLLV